MLFARDKGAQVEQEVCRYLQQQGLTLIRRNYHSRGGEIDLIMQHNEVLVFVEVRYRKSSRFGSAIESVNHSKQKRLIHAATHYLQHHPSRQQSCRFDVVGVSPAAQGYQMNWIQNAFQLV